MLRKIVFVGIVSFWGLGSLKQLTVATLLSILFTAMCGWLQPYRSLQDGSSFAPAANIIKVYFEMTLTLTLVLTIVKKAVDSDSMGQLDVDASFMEYVLVAQLALPFVGALVALLKYVWERSNSDHNQWLSDEMSQLRV